MPIHSTTSLSPKGLAYCFDFLPAEDRSQVARVSHAWRDGVAELQHSISLRRSTVGLPVELWDTCMRYLPIEELSVVSLVNRAGTRAATCYMDRALLAKKNSIFVFLRHLCQKCQAVNLPLSRRLYLTTQKLLPRIDMIFNRCRNLRDAQEVIKKIKLKIVNSFNHISIRKLNKINRLCIPIIIPRGFEDIFKIIKTEIVYNNLSKAWSCTARKNGWLDEHRGKVLRANKGIVLAAVRRYGSIALANVNDERLTNDEEVLFAALRSVMNRDCFEGAGKKARDNKKLALFAVQQHGISLSAASRRLQNNFTVVLTAVRQNGLALEFASDRLKDNDEVVRAAVAQKQSAIRYASPRLQQEGEIHRQVAWAIARGEYTERDSRIGFGCAGIPAL